MIGTPTQPYPERWPLLVVQMLACVGIATMLAGWVLGSTTSQLVLGGLGLVVAAVILAILLDWRTGIYFFLVWLLFEDLARKFLGNNMAVYFGKDVLVAACYFSFAFDAWRGRTRTIRPAWFLALWFFFGLGVIQVFNWNSPSVFYGFLGLKLYFYYVPLFFLGYALIRSEEELQRFFTLNFVLASFIGVLGVVQAVVGLDFLNPAEAAPELYLSRVTRYSPISGLAVPRPSSVFVSDGRFAWYMLMVWILGLGALGYFLVRRSRLKHVALLAVAIVFGAILLSGSRGTLLYSIQAALVLAAAFFWGAPPQWKHRLKLVRSMIGVTVVAGIALLGLILFVPDALDARWAFYNETLSPTSPRAELLYRAWDYPVNNFLYAFTFPQWPWGYGTGTASLGVQYVSRYLGAALPEVGVESGYGVLLLEMGPMGPVLWLGWTLALVLSAWRVVRRLRGKALMPVGCAILWFVFLVLFPFTYGGMAPYQNFVYNAFLWLLLGVLYRLPDLPAEGAAPTRPLATTHHAS